MGVRGSYVLVGSIAKWIPFSMSSHKLDFKFAHKFSHKCGHNFAHSFNDYFCLELAPIVRWAFTSLLGLSNEAAGFQMIPRAFSRRPGLSNHALSYQIQYRHVKDRPGLSNQASGPKLSPGSQIIPWALKVLLGP